MTKQDQSDEQDGDSSSQALHNLLADLNMQPPSMQPPTWAFSSPNPSHSHSPSPSPAPAADSTGPSVPLPYRTSSRNHARSAPDLDTIGPTPTGLPQQPSLFNTPGRSIFSSGPPTSSLSVNTAQASMSPLPPSGSSRPLSALTIPSSGASRRTVHYHSDIAPASTKRSRLTRAEKEVDDPSTSIEPGSSSDRRSTSTPTALTRLFAAPEASTPLLSREPSYSRTQSGNPYTRGMSFQRPPFHF